MLAKIVIKICCALKLIIASNIFVLVINKKKTKNDLADKRENLPFPSNILTKNILNKNCFKLANFLDVKTKIVKTTAKIGHNQKR